MSHEYLGENYETAENCLSRASEEVTSELKAVPGFMVDYLLRVAEVRTHMALTEQLATLTNLLASQHEAREDAGEHTALQRIADTLDHIDRRNA